MPKINVVRFINLGVKDSLLNIPDASFEFNAKSSYVIAGNGVGKSTTIGLILNTLHPYKYSFIHGDSPVDRFLEEYILPDRPGLILIEWVLDTTDKEFQYLLTGRLSWKTSSEGLQDLYFSKSYDSTEPRFIKNFNPISNEVYKTRSEVRKEIIRKKFETFSTIKEWVDNLNNYYIHEDVVKRLIQINKKEGAAKEGITFKNREGFISYLIDYIIPIPSNASEFVETLEKGFSEFKEIPKFTSIIDYYKKIKELMENSAELHELHGILQEKIEKFLMKEIGVISTFEGIKTQAGELLEKREQEIVTLTCKIADSKEKIKMEERKEKLRKIQFYKQSIIEFNSTKEALSIELVALEKNVSYCNVFPQLKECKTIASQINAKQQVLDTEQKPLLEKLNLLKSRFQNALLQHYQYTTSQMRQVKSEINKTLTVIEDLVKEITKLTVEINHIFQEQDALKDETIKIRRKEKELLKNYPKFSSFTDALNGIERLKEQKNLESKEVAVEIVKSEKKREDLQTKEIDSEKTKATLASNINQLKSRKQKIHDSWKKLTSHIGFKLNIAAITSEGPLFHILTPHRIESLEETVRKLDSDRSKMQYKESILNNLLAYYDKNKTFPPNEDTTILREYLHKNEISAINGWDYYYENKNSIDKAWVNLYPYLFEGVIIQGASIADIHELINNFNYTSEAPLFLTEATIFERPPSLLSRDKTISLDTISWKFTFDALQEYMIDKTEIHENLKGKIKKKAESKKQIQDALNEISIFCQQTTEESYKKLNKEIDMTMIEYERILEELKKIITRRLENTRSLGDLKNKREKVNLEILQLEQDLKPFYQLENQITRLPEIAAKFEQNESKIIKHRNKKNKKDESKLRYDKGLKELEEDKNLLEIKRRDISFSAKELAFTLHGSSPTKPVLSRTETQDNYLSLKKQLNQNKNFNQIQLDLENLTNLRFEKETTIKAQLDVYKATLDAANEFFLKYESDHQKVLPMKRKLEDEAITKKVKIAELESNITSFKSTEQDLLGQFTERVPTTSLSSKELKANLRIIVENLDKERIRLQRLIENKQNLNEAKTRLKELEGVCNIQMELLSNITHYIEVSYNENFQQFNRKNVRTLEITSPVLEELQLECEKLKNSWYAEGHVEQIEIKEQTELYKVKKDEFIQHCRQLFEIGKKRATLHELDILNYLNNIRIETINIVLQEAALEIEQRELQLASQKEKRAIQINLIVDELEKSFDMINEFTRKRINPKMSPAFNDKQVIRINYSFKTRELRELLEPFVQNIFADLGIFSSFPKLWKNYLSFIKAMIESFFRGKIKSIKFLIPRKDGSAHYRTLESTLKASGGQVNTIALVLFCLMAHFKIKNQKSMHYSDYEELQKTPVSFPLISDNPIGSTSSPELVRLQVDVAKSLDIQLIYFSAHNIPDLIEEMDNKMKMQLTEKNVLTINHTLNHTPIREENYGKREN